MYACRISGRNFFKRGAGGGGGGGGGGEECETPEKSKFSLER